MEPNFDTTAPPTLRHELSFEGRPYLILVEHKHDENSARPKRVTAGGRSLPDRDECIIICYTSRLHDFDDDAHHELPLEILELALYHMPTMMTPEESATLHDAIDAWVTDHRRVAALLAHWDD